MYVCLCVLRVCVCYARVCTYVRVHMGMSLGVFLYRTEKGTISLSNRDFQSTLLTGFALPQTLGICKCLRVSNRTPLHPHTLS